MIERKVMRTLASVEIKIILILGLPYCPYSSSVRCLELSFSGNVTVPVPLPEDPYEAIRQAYLVGTDTESKPFEDPKTETPESPHIVASPTSLPDSTPPVCHVEESESSDISSVRSTSSDSTTPLSPDHPLTHDTPVFVPSLCRTARMVMHVLPAMSSSLSASIAKVAAMSDSVFHKRFSSFYDSSPSSTLLVRKRYRGTSELILDTDSEEEDDEDVKEGSDPIAPSGHGHNYHIRQGLEASYLRLSAGTGLGLVSSARPFCLARLPTHEFFRAGRQAQQRAAPVMDTVVGEPLGLGYGALRRREIASREGQPILTTWIDPEDGLLPISPVPSIVPSPVSSPMISLTVPSPVASPAMAEAGGFLAESGVVSDEIFSQRYRFRSLEHEQERTAQAALQRKLQEMRRRITNLEQERDRRERTDRKVETMNGHGEILERVVVTKLEA
ncbi:hypothetical protein Tco_0893110 [Tanacetum coccineum]|uniref:Uncharacterized protein n=1 Tax=Tanacetum coccineum TaxID=301880 RepID=A0ABQ5CAZ1_9ASTR